jgi:hypothetical protein
MPLLSGASMGDSLPMLRRQARKETCVKFKVLGYVVPLAVWLACVGSFMAITRTGNATLIVGTLVVAFFACGFAGYIGARLRAM